MNIKLFYSLIFILMLILTACGAAPEVNNPEQNTNLAEATNTTTDVVSTAEVVAGPTVDVFQPTPTLEARLPKPDVIADQQKEPPSTAPIPISITTTDAVKIAGTYYPPIKDKAPALLLLHMHNSNQLAWHEFVLAAHGAGYAVLTIDLRGHGSSEGTQDFANMDNDVSAALTWLAKQKDIDFNRIGIIGGSLGANLALRGGVNHPKVKAVVLLSPGLDYSGITTEQAITSYGDRPILLVATENDTYSAESVNKLAEIGGAGTELNLIAGSFHGTDLFVSKKLEFSKTLLTWLDDKL